jgi:hypothetical protein
VVQQRSTLEQEHLSRRCERGEAIHFVAESIDCFVASLLANDEAIIVIRLRQC